MLWIDNVPSLRFHAMNSTASATAKKAVEAIYGTPSCTCTPSAVIVPKIPTITTVSQ